MKSETFTQAALDYERIEKAIQFLADNFHAQPNLKEIAANYNIQPAYVRYHRMTDDEWKTTLEYVADAEDEAWLQKNVKFGSGGSSVVPVENATTTAATAVASRYCLAAAARLARAFFACLNGTFRIAH